MSKFLFIDSFALIKAWATGFFLLHLTGVIHILPVIAALGLLTGLIGRKILKQSLVSVNQENEDLHKKYGV